MAFRKITIVGVGLLGGSIGLAARERRLAKEVAGFVRRTASLRDCEKAGAVDYATTDLLAAVSGADFIILCTPLAQMQDRLIEMLPALKRGALVTDVGSVKGGLVRELERSAAKSGAHFVGSHPMAGAEKTGVGAARADLFENAICLVTPTRRSSEAAVRKVARFWKSLGGRPLRLPPGQHDLLVSRTSHLPHVVAATLTNLVLGPSQPGNQPALCANGFRDTTRIASGSPEMWRDIAMFNRTNLLKSVAAFAATLAEFQLALKQANPDAVEAFFAKAKQRRDHWCAGCASPSPE